MDDNHGAGTSSGRNQSTKDLSRQIEFKEETANTNEGTKRNYPAPSTWNQWLISWGRRTQTEKDSWSADAQSNDGHNTRSDGRRDQNVQFLCWCTHVYVWDPVDAQLSILGSYLRAPTTGAVEALRRVTRYLLGTKNAFIKISFWWNWWATPTATGPVTERRKSQSRGHVDADGCPMVSFLRRRRAAAWQSTNAMCSTAEEPQHMRPSDGAF